MKGQLYNKNVLRIIDVNLNRLREGLRVCEDVVRFVLNDAYSTKRLKSIRHKIQRIITTSRVDQLLLCESRNVKEDIGIDFGWLEKKSSWQSIFFANLQRAKESLRVLEEFFKLFDNRTGEKFKGIRFEVYEFEKKVIAESKALSDSKRYPPSKAVIC